MRVYSIFRSINGEVSPNGMGTITTFIRLAGCTTGECAYCDSEYAKSPGSGKDMSIKDIMVKVESLKCDKITITGGEPLEQKEELMELIYTLSENRYFISIETNGNCAFSKNKSPFYMAEWVVDIKSNSTNDMDHFLQMNLTPKDYIKLVIGSELELEKALAKKALLQQKGCSAKFAFSPVYGVVSPNQLLTWLYSRQQFDAVLNVQLHKILNLEEEK